MSVSPVPPRMPAPARPPVRRKRPWQWWWVGAPVGALASMVLMGAIVGALGGSGASTPTPTASLESVTALTPSSSEEATGTTPTASPSEASLTWDDVEVESLTACELRGDKDYPYGFTVHSVLGELANEVRADNAGRFLKYTVTIKNAYGAKYDATMECTVGGNPTDPMVEDFYVY